MPRSAVSVSLLSLLIATLIVVAPQKSFAQAKFGNAEFKCVGGKQRATGVYCKQVLRAWSTWETSQDDARRDELLGKARTRIVDLWGKFETRSSNKGVDCVEQTVTAIEAADDIDTATAEIITEINNGLTLAVRDDARCGRKLLNAAAVKCIKLLSAESKHTKRALKGGRGPKRAEDKQKASDKFSLLWSKAGSGCPTGASEADIESRVDAITDRAVFSTAVAPGLDDTEFQPVSFDGLTDTVEYEGRTLTPRCGFDGNEDYHFFVKRGSVNKLLIYYQGGGACWDNLTCGLPVCKDGADAFSDDPDNATSGFADLTNPDNPFRDWNTVFVTYCTCDIHFGDSEQTYVGTFPDVNIKHRGFENAKVAEKLARENFLNPDVVFVTGSSAGGYGALFHGGLLRRVWPASDFNILGDASSGVITASFLQNEFENWNFLANLPPDIPGVVESITEGTGMVGFIEAAATFYPQTKWAHYSTAYDGGQGGQTGFYNIMLNDNDPIAATSWWNGSCAYTSVMRQQALDTSALVPSNYRSYIGTGSRHTMYGNDKVYTDQTGGEAQTIVDWVNDMIDFDPLTSASGDWQDILCSDCEIVLPGDPMPPSIPTPPFFNDGFGGIEIICP